MIGTPEIKPVDDWGGDWLWTHDGKVTRLKVKRRNWPYAVLVLAALVIGYCLDHC